MTGLRHLFDSTIGKWLDSPSRTLVGVWLQTACAVTCFRLARS